MTWRRPLIAGASIVVAVATITPVRHLAVRWFTRLNGTWVGVVPAERVEVR
jgi:hypothetical protein